MVAPLTRPGETIESRIVHALAVMSPQSMEELAASVGMAAGEDFVAEIVRLEIANKIKVTIGEECSAVV